MHCRVDEPVGVQFGGALEPRERRFGLAEPGVDQRKRQRVVVAPAVSAVPLERG